MPSRDQFRGCLIGTALGDALGAPFEGGPLERLLWRMIGSTADGRMRWTDDTQMTLDLVESFVANGHIDADDLAKRFAHSYRWSRGYGRGTAKTLKLIARGVHWSAACRAVYPHGSWGNGAAMRSAILGLLFSQVRSDRRSATQTASEVTHAHPNAIAGATLLAETACCVTHGQSAQETIEQLIDQCEIETLRSQCVVARRWLQSQAVPGKAELRKILGNGIESHRSCVTAIYLALAYLNQPFLNLQEYVWSLGGDTDTIGAMAGAIWGASHGANQIPSDLMSRLEDRERIISLADSACDLVQK